MIVKRYSSNIQWSVGSLYAHDDFIWKLDNICKRYNEDSNIKYAYGTIPCVLSGGCVPPRTASIENAKKVIDEYNDLGISCRLTFSKMSVSDEDMKDGIANELLSHLRERNIGNINNGVIISDNKLAEYVKKEYGLETISSSVKCLLYNEDDNAGYYNSLFDIYDIVRIRPIRLIFDIDFLDRIDFIDRVEVSVNNRDFTTRRLMSDYYRSIDSICYIHSKGEDIEDLSEKSYEIIEKIKEEKEKYPIAGNLLSFYDIELLVQKGCKRFCIEGRDFNGFSFVRDLGDYIFNYNYFLNIASSILGEVV